MDQYANKYITFTINDDNGIKQIKLRKKPFFYILYTFIWISFIFLSVFIFALIAYNFLYLYFDIYVFYISFILFPSPSLSNFL